MCTELKLIIEVDGITHEHGETAAYDIRRQKELENVGFTVLRYSDDEVLEDINSVYRSIEHWILDHSDDYTP